MRKDDNGMEREWRKTREERPVKMEEGREERLLELRSGRREGLKRVKWKRGNEERFERGQTIKHIRWKGGERVITKVDGGNRNEGRDSR